MERERKRNLLVGKQILGFFCFQERERQRRERKEERGERDDRNSFKKERKRRERHPFIMNFLFSTSNGSIIN